MDTDAFDARDKGLFQLLHYIETCVVANICRLAILLAAAVLRGQ